MLCVAVACALASRAHAFSDPLSYEIEPEFGGGGGRWFSGSSADGFGCEVCHEGGPTADLAISGLPLDGFVPGAAYEIAIGWPATAPHVALIAELADEQRHGVGTIMLPRPEATPETERCSGELLGAPSSNVQVTADGRQLISVVDCGAQQVRFQWSVPIDAPEAVWLNVGFITSDEDTTPRGDGVTMAKRLLVRNGSTRAAQVVAQGCNAIGTPSEHGSLVTSLCLLVAVLWRRCHSKLEAP